MTRISCALRSHLLIFDCIVSLYLLIRFLIFAFSLTGISVFNQSASPPYFFCYTIFLSKTKPPGLPRRQLLICCLPPYIYQRKIRKLFLIYEKNSENIQIESITSLYLSIFKPSKRYRSILRACTYVLNFLQNNNNTT